MIRFFKRYLLIFIGIIFDFIVNGFLPVTFGYQGFVLTAYFGFAGLILSTRKFSLEKKLFTSFLYGVFLEVQVFNSSLIILLSILLITVIGHVIQDIFGNSMVEKGILLFFEISFLEISSYLLATILGKIKIGLVSFLTYQFILTILLNIVVIFVMLLIESVIIDKKIQNERIRKRREHISLIE